MAAGIGGNLWSGCDVMWKAVQETVSDLLDRNGDALQKTPTFKISVYVLEEAAIWQRRDKLNIFSTEITDKNASAQFAVWIIT